MSRVLGKTCIVTGAAAGIGRACAKRLAEQGANVALFDVNDDAGNEDAGSHEHDGGWRSNDAVRICR